MNRYATTDFQKRADATRHDFINIASGFSALLLFGFGMVHLYYAAYITGLLECLFALFFIANIIYLKQSKNTLLSSELFLSNVAMITLIIFANGGYQGTGHIWVILFPFIALYLQGEKRGLLWVLSHFATLLILTYFIYDGILHPNNYTYALAQQSILAYFGAVILAYLNEKLKRISYEHTLDAHNEITSVLDNMQDTFYRTDTSYRFIAVTPSIYALLGYHNYELIDHSLIDLLTSEDERDYFTTMLEKNSGHIKNLEIKISHKNGDDLWILVNAHRYYDLSNRFAGIEGTFKDITEQKHYQVELIKQTELQEQRISEGIKQLRQKDALMLQQAKMAQMGEMISMIAHQWRQPLATIGAISQNLKLSTMLKEPISDTVLNEKLTSINSHVNMLSETIDDFRNFFRPDKEKNDVVLDHVIHKAIDVLESSISTNAVEITLNLNLKTPIQSFQNELLQVLINLISNAIDAFDDTQINRYITIESFRIEQAFVITVSDNAGGINDDVIDKIFDPYFSTKEIKNGTGLGLYMSKTIIEEHCQGNLSAKNSDVGAVFTLTLWA